MAVCEGEAALNFPGAEAQRQPPVSPTGGNTGLLATQKPAQETRQRAASAASHAPSAPHLGLLPEPGSLHMRVVGRQDAVGRRSHWGVVAAEGRDSQAQSI